MTPDPSNANGGVVVRAITSEAEYQQAVAEGLAIEWRPDADDPDDWMALGTIIDHELPEYIADGLRAVPPKLAAAPPPEPGLAPRYFTDVEGTIEAKVGDRVARMEQWGQPLIQPELVHRPTLGPAGLVYEGPEFGTPPAASGLSEQERGLLAWAYDNLNDMPISEKWANAWCALALPIITGQPVSQSLTKEELAALESVEDSFYATTGSADYDMSLVLSALRRLASTPATAGGGVEALIGAFEAKAADFEDGSYRNATVRDLLRDIQAALAVGGQEGA